MNNLVKILVDDDGAVVDRACWHLVDPCNPQGDATLCTGEFFGYGESDCEFEIKTSLKGGITCSICIDKIKKYKTVRL